MIHAFEPVEAIYRQLLRNCRNYPNIISPPRGAGATNETRRIALRSNDVRDTMNQMSRIAGEETPSELQESITILRPLDDACKQFSVQQIAFLKIDVEGFELEVLRGATEMLKTGSVGEILSPKSRLQKAPNSTSNSTMCGDAGTIRVSLCRLL